MTLVALADLIDAAFSHEIDIAGHGQRYGRVRSRRTAQRAPIPGVIRRLVFARDGLCVFCGSSGDPQLDHIVPWSAGGCDCPANLRRLCASCNAARSNFITPSDEYRRLDITTRCAACSDLAPGDDMAAAYCGRCGLVGPSPSVLTCSGTAADRKAGSQ